MKFYVTHYTPLSSRLTHMISQLENAGIHDYHFILSKDRESLTKEELSKFNKLSPGEISLFYKHMEIYKNAPENEIIVIFEDDSCLCVDFLKYLYICLNELQNEEQWNALFAGDCANLHCQPEPGRMVKRTDGTRATGLSILNSGTGKQLYDIFTKEEKIDLPIDWWLSEIAPKNNLRYYWSEPPLVMQGSANGTFSSSLR